MNPEEILKNCYYEAELQKISFLDNEELIRLINDVCNCSNNRALTRLVLSCVLAKIDNPEYNICMPYTEIGQIGCFSGRTYDERYITQFIVQNRLPCNPTTAFLTPALRNITQPLSSDIIMAGNNKSMYKKAILILESIESGLVTAESVLKEAIRVLILMRNNQQKRIDELLEELSKKDETHLPSSEAIFNLIFQHLQCKRVSRLPVLIIASLCRTIGRYIGEYVRPLNSHNAADLQTKSLGDIEICLQENSEMVVTVYEMKEKQVINNDIDIAVQKIVSHKEKIHNYIFITTETILQEVQEYARQFYEKTGGTEIVILDCLGFLRYFLHLFHRQRVKFLDEYQKSVLNEPDSAVSPELKEAFLILRKVLES